jgi:hypothetical protein
VVQDVAVFRTNVVNFTGSDVPQQLLAGQVSADYFRLVGAPIVLGRSFTAEEDRPNGQKVIVLSHGLWNRRFDGSSDVLGKTVLLSGDPYTVIGVMGPSFDVSEFGDPPRPGSRSSSIRPSTDQGHYFRAAGRLKARRDARAGQGADRGLGGRIPHAVSDGAAGRRRLHRRADAGGAGP